MSHVLSRLGIRNQSRRSDRIQHISPNACIIPKLHFRDCSFILSLVKVDIVKTNERVQFRVRGILPQWNHLVRCDPLKRQLSGFVVIYVQPADSVVDSVLADIFQQSEK
ncbi:hypothetical protein D3C81_1731020 [compost metagenome]